MSNPESFKEFFDSDENPDKALPPKLQSSSALSASISGSLVGVPLLTGLPFSDKSREEFADKVSSLSHSDEFIADLSGDIGLPLNGESEEDFVARAKKAMADLLRRKLGG
jgi:hypothetical protein